MAGKNATRLSLILFALSVVVSVAPIVCKRLGYDLEKPDHPVTQDVGKIEKPNIVIYNFYFGSSMVPTTTSNRPVRPGPEMVMALAPSRKKEWALQ